ncbi:hypothetical protein C5S39_12595 [Candidatus Methanophagaceae archaeon]|nr:hypothetical protein C5S39_12595 [Methanophagales archaeon]
MRTEGMPLPLSTAQRVKGRRLARVTGVRIVVAYKTRSREGGWGAQKPREFDKTNLCNLLVI